MPYLTLILFAPWFLILGALFWIFPKTPRNALRRLFDAVTLLIAGGGSFAAMLWTYQTVDTAYGTIWKQVYATLAAYGIFLGVMTIALVARHFLLRSSASTR